MNAPAVIKQAMPSLAMDEATLITTLENSLYPGASPQSIAMVLNYCRAAGLDPMQKPAHIVPMWDSKSGRMRDVVMPGIGLYRTQAARSGEYAGVTEPEFGPDVTEAVGGQQITFPAWCKVIVKRLLANGAIVEFAATERWKENYAVKGGKEKSVAPNAMWTRRPYAQLAKCAEAQALRKAFPEFGSQPTADEMEGKTLDGEVFTGTTIDGTTGEVQPQRPEIPPYPPAVFAKALAKWRTSGTKTPDEFAAMLGTKGVLSAEQLAEIRKPKEAPAPIDGEFMSAAEVEAAHQREMAEAGQ